MTFIFSSAIGVVGKQKQRQSLHNTYLEKSYTYLNRILNMIPSSLGLAQRLKEATTPVSSYMDQIALYTWLRKHIEHVFKQWKLKWAIYFQQDSILTERLTNSRVICSIRPGRKKTDALITNTSHKLNTLILDIFTFAYYLMQICAVGIY